MKEFSTPEASREITHEDLDPVMEAMLPLEHWDARLPIIEIEGEDKTSWVTSSYEDLKIMLSRPDLYSAQLVPDEQIGESEVPPHQRGHWLTDPPRKGLLAEPLREYFLREHVSQQGEQMQEIIDAEFDSIESQGDVFDYTRTLGGMPAKVINEMIGLRTEYEDVADIVARTQEAIRQAAEHPTFVNPEGYWSAIDTELGTILENHAQELSIDARPQNPLDALVQFMRSEDSPLGNAKERRWHAIGQLGMLISAGDETTRGQLGGVLHGLSQHNLWGELQNNPQLIPSALEEMTRRYPAYPVSLGIAKRTIAIGGHSRGGERIVQPGDWVFARASAANFDERVFNDPFAVDITRNPNRHFSYGWRGRHCLGAYLAREIMGRTITTILDRYPGGLRVDRTQPVKRVAGLANSIPEGGLSLILQR